jgi:hypothetical protein
MASAPLFRLSGLTLLIGAVAALIGNIATGLLFPDNNNPSYALNPSYVPLNLLATIGSILLLLGLPGLYAKRARELGVAGLVGTVLIALTGMMFGVFFGLFAVLFQSYLAAQAPQLLSGEGPPALFPFFILGTLAQVIGSILFALPMLRGSMLPRWPGYALVVSALVAVVSFFLSGPGSPTTPLTILANVLPPALLFIVLGWLGYLLWAGSPESSEQLLTRTAARPTGV